MSSEEALQAELSAVSALRQRLQEGVEKSQQLHRSLLGHTARQADNLLSGGSSPDSDNNQARLSVPHTHQYQQPQPSGVDECDGGPGVSSSGSAGRQQQWSLPHQGDAAATPDKGSGGRTSSLGVQTSPFLTHTLFERGGPLSKEGPLYCSGAGEAAPSDILLAPSLSEEQDLEREASQDSVLSTISSLSSEKLAGMSAAVLRDLVSQLQEDLVASAQRNAMLQRELQETRTGEGPRPLSMENTSGSQGVEGGTSIGTAVDLQSQVETLRKALQLKEEETAQLRQHLVLPSLLESGPSPPSSSSSVRPADIHNQVHHLQHQVKDMNKVNSALKQQIEASKAAGSGLDPQQVIAMAMEIERLKAENRCLGSRLRQAQRGEGGNGNSGVQEVSLNGDVAEGGRMVDMDELAHEKRQPSDISLLSAIESFSQDLSRNTNRRTDSSLSQAPVEDQWSSMGQSASQLSQSDPLWAPRLMQGEGGAGSRLSPLNKVKLNNREPVGTGAPPLLNVSRRLQESQEQVRTMEQRLLATEGTVRYMSQRLRYYRSLLQAVKKDKDGAEILEGFGLLRSQSESSLLPSTRFSLSLSCNDLREAAQNLGEVGEMSGSGGEVPPVRSSEGGSHQWAAGSAGQKGASLAAHSPSRAIMNTLNQHIKAMKERCGPGVERGQQGMAQVGGQSRPKQEEDGGSNMSYPSAQISDSREKPRHNHMSEEDFAGQQSGKWAGGSLASTVSGCASDRPFGQGHQTTSSSMLSQQDNTHVSSSDVTFSTLLGNNVLDGTSEKDMTYSSFSESILPMGTSQDHRDSAWSFSSGVHTQGKRGAGDRGDLVRQDRPSAENTEGGSSGDEVTYDGNGTLHSNRNGDEGASHEETSRLKTRVTVLSDMNRTLREELSVYDTLCRSLGVQVSAEGVGSGSGESSGDETCDGEMRLLQLHLAELKRLRARLEQLDTDAQNAVQVTSLLNSQHIRRIADLEAALAQLREELAQQKTLSEQRQTVITQHQTVITESTAVRQRQEEELQLLRDNLAAVQECEVQRTQQQEAEVGELQQQMDALRAELDMAQRQARDLEEELEESQQRRESYDVKFSRSQQHLLDLENQLSKARRRAKSLEAELHKSQLTCKDLESQLSAAKVKASSFDDDLRVLRQSSRKLESELKESSQRAVVLETRLTQSEKVKGEAERELSSSKEKLQSLEEEVSKLRQQKEELCGSLQEEESRCHQLQAQLAQLGEEKQQLQSQLSRSLTLQEECQQQQQRAQHYQERMAHYEQCMRDYQHRVQECEAQVDQLRSSLQSSQGREQEADSRLHQALAHIQQLQGQVKDAESRAHTNESMAHRADTLARTLEGRLRELEAKVKETEERAKESDYELRVSQTTTSEMSITIETLKREAEERSNKLKKRDAQLKKLVEQYKKVTSSHEETRRLKQTLTTEIKLYESMNSQTEVSREKKEELMRQLLSELSQTRRLAEDLISRLEHNKRNDSPASTAGPEAADGRPSPEPRDSLHSMVSETHSLRIHTDSLHSATGSQASSLSDHTDPRHTESPPLTTPLSSPGGSTFSGSGSRPKTLTGTASSHGEADRGEAVEGGSASKSDWLKGGAGRKGAEGGGQGHLRSHSHPDSLKYWRDHPHAAFSGSAGAPRVEVDSDVCRLFAISGLEGYEKLKRENSELLTILGSMQARMAERLKTFTGVSISESVEYSTLRELQMSTQNLRICAEEEGRLLSCFWLTQLPPINARGEFYDPKLADEKESLKVELRKQKSRYDLLAHTVREQQERLHATNALRKKWETTLYKQLANTSGILERSKENFSEAGLTPPKSKSPRKSGQPIKDKN